MEMTASMAPVWAKITQAPAGSSQSRVTAPAPELKQSRQTNSTA